MANVFKVNNVYRYQCIIKYKYDDKLNTMLFSTTVDPHWFQKGNNFWSEYKTSNGNAWYVVDPTAKTKRPLFDLDNLAAQITEIVKVDLRVPKHS